MILIITGQMAEQHIRQLIAPFKGVEVFTLDISVAAFITPLFLKKYENKLKKISPDMILVPGLCPKDFSDLIPDVSIYKGPKQASLLPAFLELLFENPSIQDELSPIKPADSILGEMKTILHQSVEINEKELLQRPGNFVIRSGNNQINLGLDFRPLVISEIVDASLKDPEDVKKQAQFFIQNGADIIDIGATIKEVRPEDFRNSIIAVLELNIPVSADTMNEQEIKVAIDEGVGLILSIDEGNFGVVSHIPEDTGVVVLPTNVKQGYYVADPKTRVKRLQKIVSKLSNSGISKILADPLLEAPIVPGFSDSLVSYYLCHKKLPNVPLFAGLGNVTEFVDTDSIGMNTLLACFAVEVGIAGLLTTEERASTIYSTRELALASRLAYDAKIQQKIPKRGVIDAFFAKSDYKPPFIGENALINPQEVKSFDLGLTLDSAGYYKIWIDHQTGKIYLQRFEKQIPTDTFIGENAEFLVKKVISEEFVTELTHAAYLGRELERAEICLKLGKSYVQDEPFFTSKLG
ncbi:MAG: dihydropteroate synthase-like protein [Candidatus Hodarchaeota archaeon]